MDFYLNINKKILSKASKIKLLIMDVDGVLSDGKIYFMSNGEETKSFNTQDGLGIVLLHKHHIQTAIITGRDAACVSKRAKELNISHYKSGIIDKKNTFLKMITELNITEKECAYIGDDIVDLPIMTRVGLSVCVNNSNPVLEKFSDYTTLNKGGEGAVREICDIILFAQNHHQSIIHGYLS